MDLKQLISLLRKWLWLLILGGILGAGSGILLSRIQSPTYEATTKILITRAPQQSGGVQSVLDNSLITQTYTQLLTMQPILDATSEKVGAKVSSANIQVILITSTQIVQVNVTDGDPDRCALIANTLVEIASQRYIDIQTKQYSAAEENIQAQIEQVVNQQASLLVQIDQASASNLESQIKEVQAQMLPLQEEMNQLQQEIASLTPPVTVSQRTKIAEDQARINEITPVLTLYQQIYSNLVVLEKPMSLGNVESNQISTLQSTLNLYNQIYSSLVSSLETIRLAKLNNTSNAVQIEPAAVPETPVRPNPMLYTALAAFCGLILAGGSVLLIEYLDDTLKTPDEIKQRLNLPVIGYIAETKKKRTDKEKIMVARESHAPVNDAFRSLRNNLEFLGLGKQTKTILVTSPESAEGKTTVAANLAVTFAQDGKRVLLLDADMRQPALHILFNMSNRTGLSDVLNNELDVEAAGRAWKKSRYLKLIPSGLLTPESIELLGSERMNQALASLKKSFEVIVIDTPPCFVADAQALANKVDAVVLVIRPGYTHRDSALAAIEQFNQVGAKVAGVVLSRIRHANRDRYNRHRYYSPKIKKGPNEKHAGAPHRRKSPSLLNKFISNIQAKRKPVEKNSSPANPPEI